MDCGYRDAMGRLGCLLLFFLSPRSAYRGWRMEVNSNFSSPCECYIIPFFNISIKSLNMYFTASNKIANLISSRYTRT